MLKAVIDANVWVSALLTSGTARKVINCFKTHRFQLFYSAQSFEELLEVTARQKFAEVLRGQEKAELIDLIKQRGLLIELEDPLPAIE